MSSTLVVTTVLLYYIPIARVISSLHCVTQIRVYHFFLSDRIGEDALL